MDYKKAYIRAVAWCIVPTVLTLAMNIVCLAVRTDQNHSWMLIVNVLTDWLCGLFLVYYISCYVSPKKELYRLSRRRRETIRGVIDKIELQPIRYERITCIAVYIGQRQLFVPEGIPLPKEGENAVFSVAGNVVLEVVE